MSSRKVLGFAHRGGLADAPENTLEAFSKALAAGVTALESDVWLDAAGEPVLHHGPPRGQPLRLETLFRECGTSFDLSLDMNGPHAAERTVEVARAAGADLSRVWLCGGRGSCARWRLLDPRLRLVTDLPWRDALLHADQVLAAIADSGVNAVNLRHGRWSRRLVQKVHGVGMLAFAWDVNTAWGMRRVVRRGVDGVYSNHVRLLLPAASR